MVGIGDILIVGHPVLHLVGAGFLRRVTCAGTNAWSLFLAWLRSWPMVPHTSLFARVVPGVCGAEGVPGAALSIVG